MDMNYFLDRLQNGESMDDIGEELAAYMNEAQRAYNEQVRAKEVAEAKARMEAEAKVAAKKDIMRDLVKLLGQFSAIDHPELGGAMADASDEEIDELVETFDAIYDFANLFSAFKAPVAEPEIDNKKAKSIKITSDDAVLRNFLKEIFR